MLVFLRKKEKKLKRLLRDIPRQEIGALTIGIDEYSNPAWRLYKCVSDAINFRKMLKTVYSFCPENIRGKYNKEATKKEILNDLKEIQERFPYCVFFMSSHGYQVPTDDGKMAQGLVTYDHSWSRHGMLLDLDLKEIFIKFKRAWVFVDACHSAGITKSLTGRPKFVSVPHTLKVKAEQLPKSKDIFEFAACQANEVAYEESSGGVFTSTLIDILYHDSDIKLSDLQQRLNERVNNQHPVIDATNYNIPLFEYEEIN